MENSKLLILFQNLSARELIAFDRFVRSPYFNEHPRMVKIFEILWEFRQNDAFDTFSKMDIFNAVFGALPYDDGKFRHLMSDLLKLIEEFLVIHHFRKDKSGFQLNLLERYNERGLNKHFKGTKILTERYLGEEGVKDARYYFRHFRTESELYLHFVAQRKRDFAESLEKSGLYLDTFYIAEKLRICCVMLNNESILGSEYQIPMFEEVLVHLNQNTYEDVPAIKIYYAILNTFLDEQNQELHFLEAWDLLKQYSQQFTKIEAYDMHIYVLNFCIRRINQSGDYLRMSLDIYQSMIEKGIIVRRDFLSPWTFKNIIVIGLRLGEIEWVGEFMQAFKDQIVPEYRENAYVYNLAYFNFYQKNYDKVLELLQKVEYDDVFYNLDSKALLLKSYYELGEFEALYSLMDSFRVFLRRKKNISERHKRNFSNLIRFTRKATRILPGQKKRASSLLEQINATEQIADKAWVKEKIEMFL
ncbi:MAG: hypothetical protein AAF502_24485 [Bacteroidota bacterium]